MAGFTLDATISVLESDDLDKVVAAWVRTSMTLGVKAFLKACLVRIPIRTGFLRGAFQQLVRKYNIGSTAALNVLLNEIFVGGDTKRDQEERDRLKKRKAFKDLDFSRAGKTARTKALNAQIKKLRERHQKKLGGGFRPVGKKEYYYDGKKKVLKSPTSGIPFVTPADQVVRFSGGKATFNLDVAISYMSVNDFTSRIRGSPWGSFEAGKAGMIASLEKTASRFPAITDILASYKIVLRGERVTKTSRTKSNADGLISNGLLNILGSDNNG